MNRQIQEEGLTDAYLLGKYDGIKQGRTEAIDECIAKINRDHTHSAYHYDVYEAIMLLEQLKEQDNDN